MNRYKPIGWRNESYRHSLAAKGIKTKVDMSFALKSSVVVCPSCGKGVMSDIGYWTCPHCSFESSYHEMDKIKSGDKKLLKHLEEVYDEAKVDKKSMAGKKYSMALRKLDNDEIERLANKPGVRKIAVENFLMTVDNNDNAMYANMNLGEDAKSYKWNAATVSAIKEGIRLADRSK